MGPLWRRRRPQERKQRERNGRGRGRRRRRVDDGGGPFDFWFRSWGELEEGVRRGVEEVKEEEGEALAEGGTRRRRSERSEVLKKERK